MSTTHSNSFFDTVAKCTSRLICIGALAWFGLVVANSTGAITSRLRSDDVIEKKLTTADTTPDSLFSPDGVWSFSDTSLSIQKINCDETECERQFESIRVLDEATVPFHDASPLVAFAKTNGAAQDVCPAGLSWSFSQSELRVRLITTRSKTPCLIAAVFALKIKNQWQLTIIKPQAWGSDHLLPLPDGVRTICTRRGQSGQLQMELVSSSRPSQELLAQWQVDGWDCRHTPWGAADSFSYLCARGNEVVYAWSETTSGSRNIMLTSSTNTLTNQRPGN